MLYDFGEYVARQTLLRVFPINSFKEVFPQLPVIAIILPDEFSLTLIEVFVRKFKLLGTLICFDIFSDFLNLFITAKDAPLSKASFK